MEEEPLLLSSLLPPENVLVPLSSATKEGAVEELLDLLLRRGLVPAKAHLLDKIWEREKLMSTGIGYGVAIPHTLSREVHTPAAALGVRPSGIDFGSLDGKPTTIVFLLVSPDDDSSPHIRILARLSRVFRHASVRERLLQSSSAEEVAGIIREAELEYGQGEC